MINKRLIILENTVNFSTDLVKAIREHYSSPNGPAPTKDAVKTFLDLEDKFIKLTANGSHGFDLTYMADTNQDRVLAKLSECSSAQKIQELSRAKGRLRVSFPLNVISAAAAAASGPTPSVLQQTTTVPNGSSAAFFQAQPSTTTRNKETNQQRLDVIKFAEDEIPRQFIDPVTAEIMDDPVTVNEYGEVLDRQSYNNLIKARFFVHPMTTPPLWNDPARPPIPAQPLRSLIEDFIEKAEAKAKTLSVIP